MIISYVLEMHQRGLLAEAGKFASSEYHVVLMSCQNEVLLFVYSNAFDLTVTCEDTFVM